jgi:phosphate transport system substrate-binding protein
LIRRQVNYQSIGSGGGIKQITARRLTLVPDAILTDEQYKVGLASRCCPSSRAVVPVYTSKKSRRVQAQYSAADIFLGKIIKWNDPRSKSRIPTCCPTRTLSYTARTVPHDLIFTDYLSAGEEGQGGESSVKGAGLRQGQ